MRYWYAYTGENLILGHGRAIRQVVPHTQALQRSLDRADKHYARYAAMPHRRGQSVDAKTFTAALLAPLAVRELGTSSPPATPFSSAGEVLRLFGGLDIEQAAANFFNGRTASAYAEGDDAAVAARISQGFDNGDLLLLPRDADRLYTQEALIALPGALVFLLSRTQAERKAFAGYLRHGAPPVVAKATLTAIAQSRPVLRTWEKEARLEREITGGGLHG